MGTRNINIDFIYKDDVLEPVSSLGAVGFYFGKKEERGAFKGFVTKDIDQAKKIKQMAERMISHLEEREAKK